MLLWPLIGHDPPPAPVITSSLKLSTKTVSPQGSFTAKLTLSKAGVNLASLNVDDEFNTSTTKATQPFNLTEDRLQQLNAGQSVTLTGKYQMVGGAMGSCSKLTATFAAMTAEPVIVNADIGKGTELPAQSLSKTYCLPKPSIVYTYQVSTRGTVQSDLAGFKKLSAETLNSSLGWGKAGVGFKQVSGGGDFTLYLSAPSSMTSFSSVCDAVYSCSVGNSVVINDERWRKATTPWNNAGGSLRGYRHMVVNHEAGHWLGFGHYNCSASGAKAPVMQQQSVSLQSCKFNSWPTTMEISVLKSRL